METEVVSAAEAESQRRDAGYHVQRSHPTTCDDDCNANEENRSFATTSVVALSLRRIVHSPDVEFEIAS